MTTQRAKQTVGGTRLRALYRLIGLAVVFTVDTVVLPVIAIAGLIYMAVDVLVSLALDRQASGDDIVMGWLKGIFTWWVAVHKWVLFGHDFPGTPHRA